VDADSHRDGPEDSRWVTYDQLAEARRTSRASAIRQARRRKWRRQRDNRGNVTVLVPEDELQPSPDGPPDGPADGHEDSAGLINTLRDAFATALGARDGEIAALRVVIDAKEGQLVAYRDQIDAQRERLDAAEAAAEEARGAFERLQAADAARRGQGRWARLRAAWRGK
jgi:hypothetical protein